MKHRQISIPTHLLVLVLLLLHGSCATLAQNASPPPPAKYTGGFTATTGAIFGAMVVVFFGIALFSLCFYQHGAAEEIRANRPIGTLPTTSSEPGQRNVPKGVDHDVLETFPIMEYAAVKKLSTVKGPLECAVCLSEFADDDSLRLLPGCCHVFHPDCIDQWLERHITCPVCRADLTNPAVPVSGSEAAAEATEASNGATEGRVVIDQEDASGEPSAVIHDRFTLRLPRHMIKEIEEARKYRRSMSIAGYAFDRRGSSNGRSARLLGFVRSFSSVRRPREPDAGSKSFKRVFALSGVAEVPMSSRSIGSSSSAESQDQSRLSNVSELALLDRV